MTSMRKRKSHVMRLVLNRHRIAAAWEDRLWDRMPAIGREFGSPDFDRLMAEDHRDGVGVFDPALASAWDQP